MLRVRLSHLLLSAAYLSLAGCASAPTTDRSRLLGIPLASTHSDVGFSIFSGIRQSVGCDRNGHCPTATERDAAVSFALQVQRVSSVLQKGAQQLYPDLALRVPGMRASRFDVYVVAGSVPGSDSSADGRIALNAGLGAHQPFDEWLALVIAREMGHVIARHHEENSAASITTSVIMNLVLPGSSLLKSMVSAGGSGIASRSRQAVQAQEADAIAFPLLLAAGFRLREIVLSLQLTPAPADGSPWSKGLQRSSEKFLAQAASSNFAVASLGLKASAWPAPAGGQVFGMANSPSQRFGTQY